MAETQRQISGLTITIDLFELDQTGIICPVDVLLATDAEGQQLAP
jgi:hypothetical protein